ncbi:MAG TPA: nuclear transport factor 2 family protein [Thermoanaerobaculia bacterium]|nr:nuclear transport factor 2 family protein [Thermoanaerobaculia bacterium]
MKTTLLIVLLVTALSACTATHIAPGAGIDSDFHAFLRHWEDAQSQFIKGDPSLWKRSVSHRADVTILGGFGGYGEKGWDAVGARYDWASAQYAQAPATVDTEYLSIVISGDLAFTVAIERQTGMRAGEGPPPQRALRATQIFRREDGAWKLLHRHADPLVEKRAP